jgi:hypothetical protein
MSLGGKMSLEKGRLHTPNKTAFRNAKLPLFCTCVGNTTCGWGTQVVAPQVPAHREGY